MRLPPLLSLLPLLLPAESRAESLRFEFGGVIVNPALPGLAEGDPYTGQLTYDLAPTFQAPLTFLWMPPYDPSIGIDITVGDQTFSSDDSRPFEIGVQQGPASDYFFTAPMPDAPLGLYLSDSSDRKSTRLNSS